MIKAGTCFRNGAPVAPPSTTSASQSFSFASGSSTTMNFHGYALHPLGERRPASTSFMRSSLVTGRLENALQLSLFSNISLNVILIIPPIFTTSLFFVVAYYYSIGFNRAPTSRKTGALFSYKLLESFYELNGQSESILAFYHYSSGTGADNCEVNKYNRYSSSCILTCR